MFFNDVSEKILRILNNALIKLFFKYIFGTI